MMPILPQQMATGGGAPAPQQPSDIEGVRKQLFDFIKQQLNAPQPQTPQYQQTPLTPMQGFALARNPQAAGQMMQYQQMPAQANYMNQEAAFKAAMEGKHQALQLGVALSGQEQKSEALKPGESWQEKTVNGKPHTFHVVTDPRTGQILSSTDFGEKFVKPNEPREQIMTDEFGHQWKYNLDTGQKTDTGFTKPPDQATQTEMRVSALVKDRMERAKQLISTALATPRLQRVGERAAAGEPTGIASGSDFAANARTYKNLVTELGSLTRGLYGAAGIRSYEEIQNLINVAPPWSSGATAIQQWYDNMQGAIQIADAELQRVHPYLAGVGKTPSQVDVPNLGGAKLGIPRSKFNTLPPAEQQRALKDSVPIIEGR